MCCKIYAPRETGFCSIPLHCFLINSPCWSKRCDCSECIVELSTGYVLCKARWQGLMKDTFLNGAVYSDLCAAEEST